MIQPTLVPLGLMPPFPELLGTLSRHRVAPRGRAPGASGPSFADSNPAPGRCSLVKLKSNGSNLPPQSLKRHPNGLSEQPREDLGRQFGDAAARELHLRRGGGNLQHQVRVHHDVHLGHL